MKLDLLRHSSYLLLLIFISFNAIAQKQVDISEYKNKLESFVSGAMNEIGTVPGVSMVVVKGNKTLYAGGLGYADLEKKLPMSGNTSFYIASCTKSFTSLLASILDEEGVMDLDMTLAEAAPKITFDPEIKANQIRMRDFLNHTAGVSHPSIVRRLAYTGNHNQKMLMGLLNKLGPNKAGYGEFNYTNLGYNIYTILLEEKTAKPWQKWMEEKVFQPLQMNHTTAYISKAQKKNWPMAKPYGGLAPDQIQSIYLEKQDNTMQSAGGLITTAEDIAIWLKMQLHNGQHNGKQVFSSAILAKTMANPAEATINRGRFEGTGYSLGWAQGEFSGRKAIWHSGGFPGYLSVISFMPEEDMGVAVFVNDAVSGFWLQFLLANYAYDAYLQPEGWEKSYDKEKAKIVGEITKVKSSVLKGRAKRAKRTWTLNEPFKNYTGSFSNELMGDAQIQLKGPNELEFTMGNLHCIATPFTEDNTMRIELVPGRGSVVWFNMDGDKVSSFKLNGQEYKRVQ